jgi:hypothetical protein
MDIYVDLLRICLNINGRASHLCTDYDDVYIIQIFMYMFIGNIIWIFMDMQKWILDIHRDIIVDNAEMQWVDIYVYDIWISVHIGSIY